MGGKVSINPLSADPTAAWEQLRSTQVVQSLQPPSPSTPPPPQHVRFVCVSDTHGHRPALPDGDVMIHAGDFTNQGDIIEVKAFNVYLGSLPHKTKIVVAGNHELSFDPSFSKDYAKTVALLTNCTYLQDSSITVHGIKIYGSPWQPRHGGWAFNLPRGKACLQVWDKIPDDTDVLVTHGPPLGHGDWCVSKVRAGCAELLTTVQQRVKPAYHVFGHIHEGYGITTDGHTIFINASICNINYRNVNPPIIFDLPCGNSKT